MSNKNNI
jgi:hypothetical protein